MVLGDSTFFCRGSRATLAQHPGAVPEGDDLATYAGVLRCGSTHAIPDDNFTTLLADLAVRVARVTLLTAVAAGARRGDGHGATTGPLTAHASRAVGRAGRRPGH